MQDDETQLVTRNELIARVGQAIRSGRLAKGLRQARLADLMEVDPVTVRRWECGVRLPTMVEVANLGLILGSDALSLGLFGARSVVSEGWGLCCEGEYFGNYV